MEKIKWGIIGPGSIANNFADGLTSSYSGQLVGIASKSDDRRKSFGDKYDVHEDFSFETWEKHKKDFLPYHLFNELKNQRFEFITDVYAQEACLYSDKYKVAGRVDCIADYKGKLSIIDFKTSTRERIDAWNENYYIQGSAYAEMFGERTGIIVEQVVILVVTEDGTVQEFIKQKHDYIEPLIETINEWREKNEVSIDSFDERIPVGMRP